MPEAMQGQPYLPRLRKGSDASCWTARYTFADICGQSPTLAHARELARQAAQAECAVLLLGESGTGKELFAQAIHRASPRQAGPFVPIDCAAIPRELLEAELFGYAPGAFSGATAAGKPGKFELAHGGTVFLDEIGEMPLEMQVKLLRVLQEHQVVRLGGLAPAPVDFTVIAATNRAVEAMATRGEFRRDLLYRLDVMRIAIPPLRERPEDIRPLVADYWERKSRELGKEIRLSEAALRLLEQYSWPGNVREVVNMVERLLVSATKFVIEPEDLPLSLWQERTEETLPSPRLHLATVVAEVERHTIEKALRQAQGNHNEAARLVGISRASFYRKLKRYGLLRAAPPGRQGVLPSASGDGGLQQWHRASPQS
ncbi:MAG: sigma 54-interacting transcriptional regulator [Nitrospinae bacterium]|nr:sigma 54-interacting transcriptional regulator [Nitrospinota bacterium]